MWLPTTTALLILTASATGAVEPYFDDDKKQQAVGVQHAIYSDDFEMADSLGRLLSERYSDDPLGPFCRAAALLGKMFDREEAIDTERFFAWLDEADSLATAPSDTASPNRAAWMAFYRGHVRSYRALWESRFGSSVRAIRSGYSARSEYERGLEIDSTCYDLYLGLGLYHYWKSAKGGILRRLKILKNEMERGVAELRLAADSSAISREAARNSLIWVRVDRKQYDSAIVVSREMAERFPRGKLFLWPLAEAYYRSEDYEQATHVYHQLRNKLATDPGNFYNLIECDYHLYRCYDELDRDDEARAVARCVTEYLSEIPEETGRRQCSKLAFLMRKAQR